jgi:3-oxoacyl-(acyl-carrier-protein) synthase
LVAAASLALWSGQVPPTIRSVETDPELYRNPLDGEALGLEPRLALVSALGEDGNAFAAVLRRYEP